MNIHNYGKNKTFPFQWRINRLNGNKTIEGVRDETLKPGENIAIFSISDPKLGQNLWSEYNPQLPSPLPLKLRN